jgi:teichuronic acid biosynthesis glycosyltransferase TuaG
MSDMISVIMPVYNAGKFIDEAVESVVSQSYANWELLLIDDGSNDGSIDILREWSNKDGRISILQHPNGINKGVSSSRNMGLKYAKGEWVAFLDADDVWMPEKLQKQFEKIMEINDSKLYFLYSTARVIDENGNIIKSKDERKEHNPKYDIIGAGKPGLSVNSFRWVTKKGFEAPTSSVIVKTDIIKHLGGFEEDLNDTEDAIMWYRIIEIGNHYFIPAPLSYYRVHNNQWNARVHKKDKIFRRFTGYERLLEILTFKHNRIYIAYLLVNKGFRIIVRNNMGLQYFNFRLIMKYIARIFSNGHVPLIYKFYSLIVFAIEILLLPLRIIKKLVR